MIESSGNVDRFGLRVISQLIAEQICCSACYREATASTNSDALSDLHRSPPTDQQLPRLYLADRQTDGRGRQGNRWLSDHDSLTFSLVVPFVAAGQTASPIISIAAGVAVAQAIEFVYAPVHAQLKWPNDVYLCGGKVAGILIETSQAFSNRVVIGIGMNINNFPQLEPNSTAAPPQSIFSATGKQSSRFTVLEPVVRQLCSAICNLQDDPNQIIHEFRSRCMLTGKQISFYDSGTKRSGLCEGISDDGALQVQTSDGRVRCESGAVNLVRLNS